MLQRVGRGRCDLAVSLGCLFGQPWGLLCVFGLWGSSFRGVWFSSGDLVGLGSLGWPELGRSPTFCLVGLGFVCCLG